MDQWVQIQTCFLLEEAHGRQWKEEKLKFVEGGRGGDMFPISKLKNSVVI